MGEKKEKKSKKKEEAPPAEAPAEAPAAEAEAPAAPKKAAKASSNVFALFKQSQIQEFKEAFAFMDADRDGIIIKEDLGNMYSTLGREPDSKQLDEMIAECPGQLNFTAFLTLFGEKLHGTDPEATLRDAFKMFDENDSGKLSEEFVKDLLSNVGDCFSKDELKQTFKEAPVEGGMLDYLKFVQIIKRGKEEEQ